MIVVVIPEDDCMVVIPEDGCMVVIPEMGKAVVDVLEVALNVVGIVARVPDCKVH